MTNSGNGGGAFNGFGADWKASGLSPAEARRATDWVEAKIDKRALLTSKERKEDVRDIMWQLEKDGEILVHRVGEQHDPVIAKTLYGWDKKIPTNKDGLKSEPAGTTSRTRLARPALWGTSPPRKQRTAK